MRIRKDARIEQRRAICSKKPLVVSQQHREGFKGLVGFAVQIVGVDDGGVLEEFGGGGGAEGVRNGELYEGVGRGGGYVKGCDDGGEVGGGEVEGINLRGRGP